MNKPWPKDDKTVSFHEVTDPIMEALKFTHSIKRKNTAMDVPWKGLDIGESQKATCFVPDENLTADSLAFQLEDQGRTALEVIIGIAVQLGMEQGRRVERGDRTSLNLAFIYAKELNRMNKIVHTSTDCPRVALRLTCNECGYPASEARYNDESELPANFITDRDLDDENTCNMHLYDKNYRYTSDANLLDETVREVLEKTFNEYLETGYSPREISQIMQAAIGTLELVTVLGIPYKNHLEKTQKAEVGDGIDRVDVPPTRGGTG